MRQAMLAALKSFGFALVYIPKSYLIVCTFLSMKFTLSVIYGSAGARTFKEPELNPSPCGAADGTMHRPPHLRGTYVHSGCHQLHGQHHCCFSSKLGLNPHARDLIPVGTGKTMVKPCIGLPNVQPRYKLPSYARSSRAGVFSAFLPVFHTNLRLCAKICAVGRLPGCSATTLVLSRAWGGGQLPASVSERERGQHLEKAFYMFEPALLSETR